MNGQLHWERDGQDWPNREYSRFLDAGGIRWHVQIAGSGPVLLLLHGTGASSHSWRDLFLSLAEDFTVIAPDLPGHGFTEAPASELLSLPGMAKAIQALLTRLDMKPDCLCGHSAGAAIAMRIAMDTGQAPAALIGINAAIMPFGGLAGQIFPVMAKLLVLNPFVPRFLSWRATDPQAVTRLIEGTGSRLDEKGLSLYRRLFASRSHVASTLAMMANWSLDALIRDIKKLSLPLLLLVGERDKAVPAEDANKLRRIVPQTSVVRVEKTGHLSHEERPDAVIGLITDFMRQHITPKNEPQALPRAS